MTYGEYLHPLVARSEGCPSNRSESTLVSGQQFSFGFPFRGELVCRVVMPNCLWAEPSKLGYRVASAAFVLAIEKQQLMVTRLPLVARKSHWCVQGEALCIDKATVKRAGLGAHGRPSPCR